MFKVKNKNKVPNKLTQKTLKETDKNINIISFENVKEIFDKLKKEDKK